MTQCSSCGGFCKKSGCERRDNIIPCKHFRAGVTNLTAVECPYCRSEELESHMQGLSNEINDFQNVIERQKHEQVVLINLLIEALTHFYHDGVPVDADHPKRITVNKIKKALK